MHPQRTLIEAAILCINEQSELDKHYPGNDRVIDGRKKDPFTGFWQKQDEWNATKNSVMTIATAILQDREQGTHHHKVGENEAKARGQLGQQMLDAGNFDYSHFANHYILARKVADSYANTQNPNQIGTNLDTRG